MDALSLERRVPLPALGLAAALIPFWATALALWFPIPELPPRAALFCAIAAGAVILAFLGGVRWGVAIGPYARPGLKRDFVLSVLPALAGLGALLAPAVLSLCLLAIGFVLQSLSDVLAAENGRLAPRFARLRLGLAFGILVPLVLMLARLAGA